MNEAHCLDVYRRGDQMIVGCSVLDPVTLCSLDETWIVSDALPLVAALAEAERAARRCIAATPRAERLLPGQGFWKGLGFRTWNQFARGATLCSILRSDDQTNIIYATRESRDNSLGGTGIEVVLPAGAPLEEVAAVVLDIFAKNPPPEPPPPAPKRKRRA